MGESTNAWSDPSLFCHWLMASLLALSRLPLLALFLSDLLLQPANATFSWPKARIPFEDDPRLTADPDMAVALNNARMDLQVRTCIRLVPRRDEQDYAYFADLGPHIECWNMFEPFPPKGKILVNAGSSCLEPMRRPHRPRRVFSECDVEYVNHLYNCPRRRKPSPICPAGRLIMARPSELATRTSTPAGAEEMTQASGITMGTEENEGEGFGEAGTNGPMDEEATTGMASSTSSTSSLPPDNIEGEETSEPSTQTEESLELGSSSSTLDPGEVVEELLISTEGTIEPGTEETSSTTTGEVEGGQEEETTALPEETTTMGSTTQKTTERTMRTTEEHTRMEEVETTLGVVEKRTTQAETILPTTPEEETSTTRVESTSWTSWSTFIPLTSTWTEPPLASTTSGHWTTEMPKTTEEKGKEGGSSPPMPDEPPATARSETRQPYPMMMTLITTTTTTTIAPPPPDWVRSVEESFQAGQRLNSGEGSGDGWRPLSTLIASSSSPMPPHSEEQTDPTGPPEPKPIQPEKEGSSAESGGSGEEGQEQGQGEEEKGKDKGKAGRRKGGAGTLTGGGGEQMAVLGLIQLPPGASISIREKTKITKLVEKTKYIGPCGSACTYGGQLVRLYRSFNSNPQVSDHFYTTERLEQHLMASQGFLMEPSMGFLGRNQVDPNCSCIRPLYRLYSAFAKDHFLTCNDQEKAVAETLLGYVFERILGYCTREPGCGAYLPLYRFFNAITKDHFYTADQQEMHYYKTHPELAYGFERIECYVWQHSSSAKGCPALTLDMGERRREDHEEFTN